VNLYCTYIVQGGTKFDEKYNDKIFLAGIEKINLTAKVHADFAHFYTFAEKENCSQIIWKIRRSTDFTLTSFDFWCTNISLPLSQTEKVKIAIELLY